MSVSGTLLNGRLQQSFTDWLYSGWNEEKYNQFLLLYSFAPTRAFIDYKLDQRDAEYYLDRYGMTYSDIRDPRNLKSTGSTVNYIGSSYRMVSRNLDKLYR